MPGLPIGIGYSASVPSGATRPIALPDVSTNHIYPPAPRASARGALSAVGIANLRSAPFGDRRTISLVTMAVNHRLPTLSKVMPHGYCGFTEGVAATVDTTGCQVIG